MSDGFENYSRHLKTSTIRDRANTLDLRTAIIPASSGTEDRWLVMCNGRTEWIEKYAHLPFDLHIADSTGYMTWDHRGQGASGGARAWIDDYDTYSKDMADTIHATLKGKPYNLVCHSMGGLIALHGILHGYIQPRCLVLCSPLLGMPNNPVPSIAAYKIAGLLTQLGLGHIRSGGGSHSKSPFSENRLTHSAERFAVVQNSPFPVRSVAFQWVKASYEAAKLIHDPNLLKNLICPVLVLSGTEETVVDISAVQPWVQLARQHAPGPIDLHWIQGGRHELLFESKPYFDRTTATISEWFTKIGMPI